MYSLDYGMVIQVLRQFNYTGEAYADVSARSGLKEEGRVVLTVQDGTVISCVIVTRKGQKLYHDAEAYQLLSKLGVFDWKLTTSQLSKPVQTPPTELQTPRPVQISPGAGLQMPGLGQTPATELPTPRLKQMSPAGPPTPPLRPPIYPDRSVPFYPRRLMVSQAQMRSWSVLQRSVYLLSDGTRSDQQIAALLSRPLNLVEQAIHDLQTLGAIENR